MEIKPIKKDDYHSLIIEEYEVDRGFPVVMILNSKGKYIDRIRGFGDKETYSTLLKNYTNDIFTMEYYQNQLKINSKNCESLAALAVKYQDRRKHDKVLKYAG